MVQRLLIFLAAALAAALLGATDVAAGAAWLADRVFVLSLVLFLLSLFLGRRTPRWSEAESTLPRSPGRGE
jgi:uncharacterized membrane protein YtjA (UPF0391 family)